jgi:hypothetical protein
MRYRYPARNGWTPSGGKAYTVDGSSWAANHRASVRSGKYQSGLVVSGRTAAICSAAHVSRSISSSWEKDWLARCTCAPLRQRASANGRPAYTSNPPPAPAMRMLRAAASAANSGGTANEYVPGSPSSAAGRITAQ